MSLEERIYALVRAVPAGRVTTYGQLGAMCGLADARRVGDVMNAAPADVPWQRVINSRGEISLRGGTGARQRALLDAEGVTFDRAGRVDLSRCGWRPDPAWLISNGYRLPPPFPEPEKPDAEQLSLF